MSRALLVSFTLGCVRSDGAGGAPISWMAHRVPGGGPLSRKEKNL